MRTISYWASCNKTTARLLIVILNILLVCIAIQVGLLFTSMHIRLPQEITFISTCILAVILLTYKKYKHIYWIRKIQDTTLAFLGFACMVTMTNHLDQPLFNCTTASATSVLFSSSTHVNETMYLKEYKRFSAKERKSFKKEIKLKVKELKKLKANGGGNNSDYTASIVLLVLLALILTGLLGALVCNISCGGSSSGAVLVGLLGLGVIIFGLSKGIRAVKRKYRKKTESEQSM